jgi:hypothetical protein
MGLRPMQRNRRGLAHSFERMNTVWFKTHRIFIITLVIAVAHFILTSVVGRYIAVQIGTQVGQLVAEGLIETYGISPQSVPKSEEEAKRVSQDMKNKRDYILGKWEIPSILISSPIKRLMNPFLKNIMEARMKMVISKEISREQFYTRGFMIDYAATFVNSFCLGFLVYVILRMLRQYEMKP